MPDLRIWSSDIISEGKINTFLISKLFTYTLFSIIQKISVFIQSLIQPCTEDAWLITTNWNYLSIGQTKHIVMYNILNINIL